MLPHGRKGKERNTTISEIWGCSGEPSECHGKKTCRHEREVEIAGLFDDWRERIILWNESAYFSKYAFEHDYQEN